MRNFVTGKYLRRTLSGKPSLELKFKLSYLVVILLETFINYQSNCSVELLIEVTTWIYGTIDSLFRSIALIEKGFFTQFENIKN